MTQAEINKQINREKYYIIRSKILADALEYITGQRPYRFDDAERDKRYIYSFKNTDNFEMVLTKLNELRKKYYNKRTRYYSKDEFMPIVAEDGYYFWYEIRDKRLANTIKFINNEKFTEHKNFNVDRDVNKKIYEFRNTIYLHEILDAVEELKREYGNN